MIDRELRFGMFGTNGYIAPSHLQAMLGVGGKLVQACDVSQSAGIIQKSGHRGCKFTRVPEIFVERLDWLNRQGHPVDYLVVATPNWMHATHVKTGLEFAGCDVICEKPLTIHPWTLEGLEYHEQRSGHRVWTVLQTRYHPNIVALRPQLGQHHKVVLDWATERDEWYHEVWKGIPKESGGLISNIGVHQLDLLLHLFGLCGDLRVDRQDDEVVSGFMALDRADVTWRLSIEAGAMRRTLTVDGQPVDLTHGFTNLHTTVYQEILAGRGLGIDDARPAIELAERIRTTKV